MNIYLALDQMGEHWVAKSLCVWKVQLNGRQQSDEDINVIKF